MLLEGKVALITGAGSGMGKAQTQKYAEEGAKVIAVDINLDAVEKVVQEITNNGGEAIAVKGDISKKEEVDKFVKNGLDKYDKIDILCNTAGIMDDFKPTLDVTEEYWDKVMNINLKGMFLLTNSVLPQMIENGKGTIINFSSIAGFVAGAGGSVYTATKHGVIGYTKQLSLDYGPKGIKANAICPGGVETGMTDEIFKDEDSGIMDMIEKTPAGRPGKAKEIADLSLFLASDKSDFIHGEAIKIDGGWTVN